MMWDSNIPGFDVLRTYIEEQGQGEVSQQDALDSLELWRRAYWQHAKFGSRAITLYKGLLNDLVAIAKEVGSIDIIEQEPGLEKP